jgi:hypothetical protein
MVVIGIYTRKFSRSIRISPGSLPIQCGILVTFSSSAHASGKTCHLYVTPVGPNDLIIYAPASNETGSR